MNKNNLKFLILPFIFLLIISIQFFYTSKVKNDLVSIITENKEKFDFVYSGINIDEKRLLRIKQIKRIIKISNPILKENIINSISLFMANEMEKYPNLNNPFFVCAWINQESGFNKDTSSVVGAKGLTQIMTETSKDICDLLHWNYYSGIEFNIEKNLIMGFFYLNKQIDLNGGNVTLGLVSYNAGFRMRNRYKLIDKYKRTKYLSEEEKYQLSLLSDEAREYPTKIFSKQKEFEKL